jgi:hypothetical protein
LVRAPEGEVRDFLSDPRAWILLQPLVRGLDPQPGEPGLYRVTERLKLLGIPVPHRYRAKVVPHDAGVDSEAWSVPFIHLRNLIRWAPVSDGTRVQETVRVTAPAPLVGYVCRTAERAHRTMLERIGAAVEERVARRRSP